MFNVNQITSELAKMADPMLQKYASMHKDDPYTVALAVGESNRRKSMRTAAQAKMAGMQQPKVVDQDIAQMAAVDPMGNVTGALPEDIGIGKLAAPNLKRMADGGIAGYAGDQGSVTRMTGADLFDKALDQEGITDPLRRAFAKAIHGQESSGRANAPTSNRGAAGPMQVRGPAWKDVATPDMDPKNPFDNMRAGIRYAMKGFDAAGGNPVLAGAHYYGGAGGMKKLMEGKAVSDPENPNAPTTAGYGKSIADRMLKFLPVGSAEAADVQKIVDATPAPAAEAAPATTAKAPAQKEDARGVASIPMSAAALGANAGIATPVYEALKPTFKPGTTVKEALTRTGVAAAVPMATYLGGAAASDMARNNLQLMSPQQRKELSDNAMLSAMSGDTGLAAAIMNAGESKEPPPSMPYGKQMGNVGSLIADTALGRNGKGIGALLGNGPKEPPAPMKMGDLEATDRSLGQVQATPDDTALKAKIDAVKEKGAEGASEQKGSTSSSFFNDPMGMLGLQLLANKNPNLLGALGEAGQGTAKYMSDLRKLDSEIASKKAEAASHGAYADLLNRGAKDRNMQLEAEKIIQQHMEKWNAGPGKLATLQDKNAGAAESARIRQEIYQQLGITPATMAAQQQVPSAAGWGQATVR